MDPNLFHLDWERVFEGLAAIIVLSFVLERALAPVFESYPFIVYFDRPGAKEVIALALAIGCCIAWDFDIISVILLTEHTTRVGEIITGAVIAGGSKASIKLFHDVLNVKSTAFEQRHEVLAIAAAADAEAVVQNTKTNRSLLTDGRAEKKIERLRKIAQSAVERSQSERTLRAVNRIDQALSQVQQKP